MPAGWRRSDQTLALALATACLGHDDMRAAALFAAISGTSDVREAWLGLATARRRLGDAAGAAEALAAALRRHVPDPGFAALADAIARDAGAPGWCGMSGDGKVTLNSPPPHAGGGWGEGAVVTSRRGRGWICVVAADGRELLGSPIDVAAITATVGCVSCRDGGLTGWAWHPGDPSVDPVLTVRPANGRGQTERHRIRHGRPYRQQRPAGSAARFHRAGGRLEAPDADCCTCAVATAGTCSAVRSIRVQNLPSGRHRARRRHRAGARRSMWWCRCMAGRRIRSPVSTACWPICRGRAG